MASSKNAILDTFIHEGSLAMDNDDPGGFTYLGIAYNSWPNWEGWSDLFTITINAGRQIGLSFTKDQLRALGTDNGVQVATPSQIKKMAAIVEKSVNPSNGSPNGPGKRTMAKALLFYKGRFWNPIGGDKQISQSFAESMFDFGVNTGTGYCTRLVQRLIKVKADGIIGSGSLYTLNTHMLDEHHKLHTQFVVLKVLKYLKIVKKRSTSIKYFRGWLRRSLNIYVKTYDLPVMYQMILDSSKDGKTGPRNLPGYALFLEDETHKNNLEILIDVYEATKRWNKHRLNKKLYTEVAKIYNK